VFWCIASVILSGAAVATAVVAASTTGVASISLRENVLIGLILLLRP
jgi:hypothetical protein